MIQLIFFYMFVAGLFACVFVAPAMFCLGINKVYKVMDLNFPNRVLLSIPFFNYFYLFSKSQLYASLAMGVSYVLSLISIWYISFKVLFDLPNFTPMMFLIPLSILIMSYIVTVVSLAKTIKEFKCNKLASSIMYGVFFPIGQMYIGYVIPDRIEYYKKTRGGGRSLYGK